MAKRGNALSRSKFVKRTPMGRSMAKTSATGLKVSRYLNYAAWGAAGVAVGTLATGNVPAFVVANGVGAFFQHASNVAQDRSHMRLATARFIERTARAHVAKGAAKRSGKAIEASNRSGGSLRVASAQSSGNGSVKGYYRQQAGKSVFVSGYQRV